MILAIVLTILIGALIGWLAGLIMKSSHGFWMNCLIGIVGSAIGNWINYKFIKGGDVISILMEIAGTCILIILIRLIMGKKW